MSFQIITISNDRPSSAPGMISQAFNSSVATVPSSSANDQGIRTGRRTPSESVGAPPGGATAGASGDSLDWSAIANISTSAEHMSPSILQATLHMTSPLDTPKPADPETDKDK